ncbi:MAG: nucleotidyl transferase AbiEii/AbiGii toxin family protein [Planctomycetota bacterium]
MERFLYRLSESPHAPRFVLKGALMYLVWRAPRSRPTMDIDLLGRVENDVDTVTAVVRDVCSQPVEPDGLVFDPSSVRGEAIAETAEYAGVRVLFRADLGKAHVPMRVDVGFGDAAAESGFEYPTILGMPAPRLRGYSRESVVAEKFEAMVKLGSVNSRMKDFYDVWFLSSHFEFDGETLADAVSRTFARREREVPVRPLALTPAFAEDEMKRRQWQAFVTKSGASGAPTALDEVVERIATFLGPVTAAIHMGDSFLEQWKPSEGWR